MSRTRRMAACLLVLAVSTAPLTGCALRLADHTRAELTAIGTLCTEKKILLERGDARPIETRPVDIRIRPDGEKGWQQLCTATTQLIATDYDVRVRRPNSTTALVVAVGIGTVGSAMILLFLSLAGASPANWGSG